MIGHKIVLKNTKKNIKQWPFVWYFWCRLHHLHSFGNGSKPITMFWGITIHSAAILVYRLGTVLIHNHLSIKARLAVSFHMFSPILWKNAMIETSKTMWTHVKTHQHSISIFTCFHMFSHVFTKYWYGHYLYTHTDRCKKQQRIHTHPKQTVNSYGI